jgi:hypothetical protein
MHTPAHSASVEQFLLAHDAPSHPKLGAHCESLVHAVGAQWWSSPHDCPVEQPAPVVQPLTQ